MKKKILFLALLTITTIMANAIDWKGMKDAVKQDFESKRSGESKTSSNRNSHNSSSTSDSVEIFNTEDFKIIWTSGNLNVSNFKDSDFFVQDVKSWTATEDLNEHIFGIMLAKEDTREKKGEIDTTVKEICGKSKGELVRISNDFLTDGTIWHSVYDKKKKKFVTYTFQSSITEETYSSYANAVKRHDRCISDIDDCNRTIEKCSAPTVKAWKTVQVPYEDQVAYTVRVPYEAEVPYEVQVPYEVTDYIRDYTPAGSTGTGKTEYVPVTTTRYRTEIRYRTETRYRNETRYKTETKYRNESQSYDISNPDYNINKVVQAKKDMEQLQKEKDELAANRDSLLAKFSPQ